MRKKAPRADKVAVVGGMEELLAQSKGLIFTEYRGLTVAEITNLRRKLRESGGEYHVVKNTLFRRALGDQVTPEIEALLCGPTAVAFATEDAVATSKALLDFLKEIRNKPEVLVKGGLVDGRLYSVEQVTALSKIPPRQVVLGQALGTLQAPLSNFAGTLHGVLSEFARTLQAVIDKQSEAA